MNELVVRVLYLIKKKICVTFGTNFDLVEYKTWTTFFNWHITSYPAPLR